MRVTFRRFFVSGICGVHGAQRVLMELVRADLLKALDIIPHDLLIEKPNAYGFDLVLTRTSKL